MAGADTLDKLYSKDTTTSPGDDPKPTHDKVEMADWWTVVDQVFKIGDIATVTDVKTGISYKVRRHGGSHHADSEPLTAADSAKMKQIFGGSWSWERRAIWVDIDGRRFAASQNGMPHGSQSLNYNNFQGHFCIHFLNSRTHGSNQIDNKHQAMIHYANEQGNK